MAAAAGGGDGPSAGGGAPDGPRSGAITVRECPDLDGNVVLDCKESLIINPDFKTGLDGWTAELNMTQSFASIDGNGNPSSGSIAVTNASQSDTALGSVMGGSKQCVPTAGLTGYDLYLETLFVPSLDGFTSSGAAFEFYSTMDCSGAANGSFMPPLADSNLSGWRILQGIVSTPGNTRSMLVRLVVLKPFKQAPTQALFDNILLKPR
jgi:hypothetical protein